jgi:hypothetical protein
MQKFRCTQHFFQEKNQFSQIDLKTGKLRKKAHAY